jgi:alpha-galactosidase
MDPSRAEVLEKIYEDARRFNEWGYELIKHDFSTYDIFGKWGFQMGCEMAAGQWSFADESKTSAEIIRNFYQTIRDGAGEMLVLGCNTIGHLGAGIFDIQRTGDDNGADEWDRTRKMAINTLGFRMSQHGTFFTADPDCVAITEKTSWPMSRQLLDLFSKSGTMLFISADSDKLNNEQKVAIKTAFGNINKNNQPGEPLDWMDTTCPRLWKVAGEKVKYDWYDKEGVNPFKI